MSIRFDILDKHLASDVLVDSLQKFEDFDNFEWEEVCISRLKIAINGVFECKLYILTLVAYIASGKI